MRAAFDKIVEGQISAAALQEALAAGDASCPFSTLLRHAGVEVHVTARLA